MIDHPARRRSLDCVVEGLHLLNCVAVARYLLGNIEVAARYLLGNIEGELILQNNRRDCIGQLLLLLALGCHLGCKCDVELFIYRFGYNLQFKISTNKFKRFQTD